jgi:hypothetical protein
LGEHERSPFCCEKTALPGQVKERVFAVTPTGGQIETTAGVNLSQYYACMFGGQNNPGCSGYTPQPPSGYGYLHNQAANAFASGLKVDGALTLWGAGEVAGQASRNGTSQQLSIWISPSLSGTPLTQGLEGSFVKRTVPGWREVAGQVTRNGGYERDYMGTYVDVWAWVPGGGSEPPPPPKGDPSLDKAVTIAIQLLTGIEGCEQAVSSKLFDGSTGEKHAVALLAGLYVSGNLASGSLTPVRGNRRDGATVGIGEKAKITINTASVGDPLGYLHSSELKTEATVALMILHELAHATGRYTHPDSPNHPGDEIINDDVMTDRIFDACLKGVFQLYNPVIAGMDRRNGIKERKIKKPGFLR